MTLSHQIKLAITPWQMLRHPFYKAWTDGTLTLASLQNYSLQYRPFIDHFPCYVSAIHSRCEDKILRQELLRNLIDEEGYPDQKDHPTLWKNFSVGLGVSTHTYDHSKSTDWAEELHQSFSKRCHSSYHEGLGALFSYEQQIPEISGAKIQGLKEYFSISDPHILEFFTLHQTTDIFHSESCEKLLDSITDSLQQKQTLKAAVQSSQDLWNFLSHCEQA